VYTSGRKPQNELKRGTFEGAERLNNRVKYDTQTTKYCLGGVKLAVWIQAMQTWTRLHVSELHKVRRRRRYEASKVENATFLQLAKG
jgi:hypothetical protein